jgi:hypothetical protein
MNKIKLVNGRNAVLVGHTGGGITTALYDAISRADGNVFYVGVDCAKPPVSETNNVVKSWLGGRPSNFDEYKEMADQVFLFIAGAVEDAKNHDEPCYIVIDNTSFLSACVYSNIPSSEDRMRDLVKIISNNKHCTFLIASFYDGKSVKTLDDALLQIGSYLPFLGLMQDAYFFHVDTIDAAKALRQGEFVHSGIQKSTSI